MAQHEANDGARNILAGPGVSRWDCPCCGESVPRLLPNGARNAVVLELADCVLSEAPIKRAVRELAPRVGVEICLGCRDTVWQLLGTLVTPETGETNRPEPANAADTAIIGAVLLGLGREAVITIFSVQGGMLTLSERVPLSEFAPSRMIYPEHQGDIDNLMWWAYQAHVAGLPSLLETSSP